METLGNAGNLYLILLIVFLVGGSALLGIQLGKAFWQKTEQIIDQKGGGNINKWYKLAAVSLVGILVTSFALGFVDIITGDDHHSAHGSTGQTPALHGPYGQNPTAYGSGVQPLGGSPAVPVSYTSPPVDVGAQLYQLQVNMNRLQQQLNQLTHMYTFQHQGQNNN